MEVLTFIQHRNAIRLEKRSYPVENSRLLEVQVELRTSAPAGSNRYGSHHSNHQYNDLAIQLKFMQHRN